jgi:hypothetical protein
MCDALHIGSIDGGTGRAYGTLRPVSRGSVWRRDGSRCQVPGCRSSAGWVASSDPSHRRWQPRRFQYRLICFRCRAHHAGTLTITGSADLFSVRRPGQAMPVAESRAHVGAPIEPSSMPVPAPMWARRSEPSSDVEPGARGRRAGGASSDSPWSPAPVAARPVGRAPRAPFAAHSPAASGAAGPAAPRQCPASSR